MTGAKVDTSQIDKCHRLKKESSVIVEFKCRDQRDPILLGRKKLKHKKAELERLAAKDVIISESLCWTYKKLDFLCRKLKSEKKCQDTWFFNGKLFLVTVEEEKKQITHIDDLFALYGEETVLGYLTRQ